MTPTSPGYPSATGWIEATGDPASALLPGAADPGVPSTCPENGLDLLGSAGLESAVLRVLIEHGHVALAQVQRRCGLSLSVDPADLGELVANAVLAEVGQYAAGATVASWRGSPISSSLTLAASERPVDRQ